MLANPEAVIKRAPPGTMIYARVTLYGKDVTAFLIREESARIARWHRERVQVQLRAAVLPVGDVVPAVFMVRLGDEIYEAWLNVHQRGMDGFVPLRDLARQDEVHFILYGDGGERGGKISVLNSIQGFAKEALTTLRSSPAWSMEDFDAAREQIYREHPTVADLWEALGEMSGSPEPGEKRRETGERALPRIDVVDMSGHPIPPDRVLGDLHHVTWAAWNPSHDSLFTPAFSRKKAAGVVGIGSTVAVRFLHPRDADPVSALHDLEEAESLEPSLAGALIGAIEGTRRGVPERWLGLGVHLLAALCKGASAEITPSRMRSKEVSAVAARFLDAIIAGEPAVSLPAGAVDRARFWLTVGRFLWKPSTMRRLAASSRRARIAKANMLAGAVRAWFALSGRGQLEVNGVRLTVPSLDALPRLWDQALEWIAGGISADALRWLVKGGQIRGWQVDLTGEEVQLQWDEEKRSLASAVARSLIAEAGERGVYAPLGAFRVILPEGVPLRGWGVVSLRVWAEPDSLWVQALGSGEGGPVFHWSPDGGVDDLLVSPRARPAVDVTLAALWRDLRVAGESAVPVHSIRRTRRRPGSGQKAGAVSPPKPRLLPSRRRAIRLSGWHSWSSKGERERIHRRAHGVRGHLRRLSPGWHASEEALRLAESFGVVVPQGHTFVRPHVRGTQDAGQPAERAETPVVARGLATLISLLGGD